MIIPTEAKRIAFLSYYDPRQRERERERVVINYTKRNETKLIRERERDEDHSVIGAEVQSGGVGSGDIGERVGREPLRLFPEVKRQGIHRLRRSHRR